MAHLEPAVDYIFSSPATRAAQTDAISSPYSTSRRRSAGRVHLSGRRRHAARPAAPCPGRSRHIVLIGHNPGLEELSTGLCSGARTTACSRCLPPPWPTSNLDIRSLEPTTLGRWAPGPAAPRKKPSGDVAMTAGRGALAAYVRATGDQPLRCAPNTRSMWATQSPGSSSPHVGDAIL